MIIGALNNKEKLHSKVPEIMAYTEDLEEISKVLDEGDILFALDDNKSFLITKNGVIDFASGIYTLNLSDKELEEIKTIIKNSIEYEKSKITFYEDNLIILENFKKIKKN